MNDAPRKSPRILSRRHQAIILAAAIAFITLAAMAAFLLNRQDNGNGDMDSSKTADSFKPSDEQWAGFKIAPVGQMVFRSEVEADGKIAIDDDAVTPVFSPYSGRVTRLIAKAGDAVKQGDPLFSVEATEFAQEQNDLIAAAANLRTAQAQLKLAAATEKRQHELYAIDGSALKNWQQSQADLANAQAALRSDETAYAAARSHLRILGKTDADIDAIEKTPDAQKMNADAVVVAPRDGTVIQRQIGLGQYIQVGAANPVYVIGDLSTVWLLANVREADAGLMHPGASVEVRIPAYPDRVYKAKLTYVAAALDPATHRLPVRAEVDNPDGSLKPEMFASFRITTGDDAKALAVPESAVIYEGPVAHAWAAEADKTLTLREIKTGHTNDGMIEVVDGLKSGDRIVTSGALFIDRAAAGD